MDQANTAQPKEYTYWLPDDSGNKAEYTTQNNAVIIIGANGAGKSKLGAWIERQSMNDVHRVGAQRNLNFNEDLQLKSYSEAENWVFYGTAKAENGRQKSQRWNWGHYTTKLMDDFDNVLAALIALRNNESNKFLEDSREAKVNGTPLPEVPETSIDKLKAIWSSVLPQRELIEDDAKFYAKCVDVPPEDRYPATEMSDGERAVLYLAAQVLCVPKNKILIIDEPELHLHRSIMNRLWKTLEAFRDDCLFIYITHDLHFAAAHGNVDKYWIKEFDGSKWQFVAITDDGLPEELMLEILGSRRNVLFVEGVKNSYDFQLYSQFFSEYLIIPCEGCSQVIERTKAFGASSSLHECKVFGLIDRDYRSDHELEKYRQDNIFALEVAEVENLFLVEELVKFIAGRVGQNEDTAFARVKEFVIGTKFSNMIHRQIRQSVAAEIKYRLSCIDISGKNDSEAKDRLKSGLDEISYDDIKEEKEAVFRTALEHQDYRKILRIFNEKGIAAEIGKQLWLDKQKYQETVVNLLRGPCHDEIIAALEPYIPSEIPR